MRTRWRRPAAVLATALLIVTGWARPSVTALDSHPAIDGTSPSTAGGISQGPALVHRLEQLSGGPARPAGFDAPPQEDLAAIVAAYWTRKHDPRAAPGLAPYLARPPDRARAAVAAAPAPDVRTADHRAAAPAGESAGASATGDCGGGDWVSQAGRSAFRIWSNCSGEYARDLRSAASAMDVLWGPMTGMMGPPLPDDGAGGDSRLDVYLVDDASQCAPGRTSCYRLGPAEGGRAVPAAPDDGRRTSAFLILPRSVIADVRLRATLLAHEFFHALQFAHNARGLYTSRASHWFVEASAEWAQSHFARESAGAMVYQPQFVDRFQRADLPLNRSLGAATGDGYRAFIWPYFMQQEHGADPAIIGSAWDALERAYDFASADEALDSVFSFADHFREFAFRNLNRDFLPGSPILPRYTDMDPAFPANAEPRDARRRPVYAIGAQAGDVPPVRYREQLAPLTSHYWVFAVDPAARQIDIDLSGLAGGQPVADAAVLVGHGVPFSGEWQRVLLGRGRTTWCRDDPERDIKLIFLVVSNASYRGTAVDGSIATSGLDHCTRASGTLTWTREWSVPASAGRAAAAGSVTVVLDLRFDRVGDRWVDTGSTWSATGASPLPDRTLGRADGGCRLIDRAIVYEGNGTLARAGPRGAPGLRLVRNRSGGTALELRIQTLVEQVHTVAGASECGPGPRSQPLTVSWRPGCEDGRPAAALPDPARTNDTVTVSCRTERHIGDPDSGAHGVERSDLRGTITFRPRGR